MAESEADTTDRDSDAPREISDQNREEPSAPHGGDPGEPGQSEETDTRHPPHTNRSSQREEGAPGGAGESSQATGHPDNAGWTSTPARLVFGNNAKPSFGRTAATGILVDPEIRRAAAHAVPPVARLGFTIGRRMARQEARRQLGQAEQAFSTLGSMLTTAGPALAEQLGLIEPRPRRRLGPALGAAAAVVTMAILAADPRRRQKLQRLIVH